MTDFEKRKKEVEELCRRRFFFRQGSEIYGGVSGFFTYGPPGCALKTNIIQQWRNHFIIEEQMMEIEDTNIMPYPVLKASGHVDRFSDFLVRDTGDEKKFFRADKLLEDFMEAKMKEKDVTPEKLKEYTVVKNKADGFTKEELSEIFKKYGVKSPDSGNALTEPEPFNLMFPTPIGPSGMIQGYLRPETAQGIFLNYKFCLEQGGNKLPFGIAQVGKSFRNEIAPRQGLTRQREFTQAEIEFFVKPTNKAHPKFKGVADLKLLLFSSPRQLAGESHEEMTIGKAVQDGTVNNETLGYFIVRTFLFLTSIGIKPQSCRFRQHLPTEMAHYAADCWDCEIECCYGWLECVGIADRSAFDLNAHAKAAKCDLNYKETLDKPIETEVTAITKASGIAVMKKLGKDGRLVKEYLETCEQGELQEIERKVEGGPVEVEVEGRSFALDSTQLLFERKIVKQTVNSFTPGVIEPSFGIDRIFTSLLEHSYYVRPKEEDSTDTQTRGVLSLAAGIAPYKCAILPLDQRIARHDKAIELMVTFRSEMSATGLSYTVDESGAAIGRRYARNDELGIPFALTLDFTTLEDSTATLRERDTMTQIRLPLARAAELIRDMCSGESNWEAAFKEFGASS
mmetsp:Transcript_38944/g.102916  ORF Transcript_38944/g.102916 Transcript_38944/m.102916 type:complete len:624 (-) Transcript_38944:65-1936(-)